MAPSNAIPEAVWTKVEAGLAEGKSHRALSKEHGISTAAIRHRFGPSPISPPQKKVKPKAKVHSRPIREREPDPTPQTPTPNNRTGSVPDAQLASRLAKWAVAPAIPAGLYFNCEYCAAHFTTEGPKAARQLVELSANHPELRELLETLYNGAEKWAWASILGGYVAVPLIHHLTPDPIYRWVGPVANMPPRSRNGTAPPHTHARPTPAPAPPPAPAPAEPDLSDVDLDQLALPDLIELARRHGIDVPSDADGVDQGVDGGVAMTPDQAVEPVATLPGDDAASPLPADAGIPPEPGADRAPPAEGNPQSPNQAPPPPPSTPPV